MLDRPGNSTNQIQVSLRFSRSPASWRFQLNFLLQIHLKCKKWQLSNSLEILTNSKSSSIRTSFPGSRPQNRWSKVLPTNKSQQRQLFNQKKRLQWIDPHQSLYTKLWSPSHLPRKAHQGQKATTICNHNQNHQHMSKTNRSLCCTRKASHQIRMPRASPPRCLMMDTSMRTTAKSRNHQ